MNESNRTQDGYFEFPARSGLTGGIGQNHGQDAIPGRASAKTERKQGTPNLMLCVPVFRNTLPLKRPDRACSLCLRIVQDAGDLVPFIDHFLGRKCEEIKII